MSNSMTPTKYQNSKGRRIFLSVGGKPFVRTEAGKRSYNPIAKKMTMNNGSARNLRPANVKNVPNAIRPKRVAAAKKAPVARKTNSMKATNMFRKILNKPAARKPRANKGVARKTNSAKAATKAATKMLAAAKRAAAKGPRKVRKNKGVARGPQEGVVQRRMNALSKKMAAKGPRKVRKTNSMKATNAFRKILNKPAKRKPRSNKGKARSMVASPGGTVYKGMSALTRAIRARNAAAKRAINSIPLIRRSNRLAAKKLMVA